MFRKHIEVLDNWIVARHAVVHKKNLVYSLDLLCEGAPIVNGIHVAIKCGQRNLPGVALHGSITCQQTGERIMGGHVFVMMKMRTVDGRRFVSEFKKECGDRSDYCSQMAIAAIVRKFHKWQKSSFHFSRFLSALDG